MASVSDQYEAFPYPARDPADEAKRLITGSPSDPREIDHFVFGGMRDWSQPINILVAGGGTGDGLVQLAQMLTWAKKPYQITYVDLSKASRKIAEARVRKRGLKNVVFNTGSLLDASEYGQFDYIDCCGVLHHLPDPVAGFAALRSALAPGGGLGFMVYAPYGRSGVYPLQEAFGSLLDGLDPTERLQKAKEIMGNLPSGHPFRSNPNLNDHEHSDAGFYDLLLHSQDRAFDVIQLHDILRKTGWDLAGFSQPALYDLSRLAPRPEGMDDLTAMANAEKLRGTIRTHAGYAVEAGRASVAQPSNMALTPQLKGAPAGPLAKTIAARKPIPLTVAGEKITLNLPPEAAPLVAAINGKRSLGDIAQAARYDPIRFAPLWAALERDLGGFGLMLYSSLGGR